MTFGGCLCALRALGWGNAGLGNMCQLNTYTCIGYFLPTFGGYMTVGGCLCGHRAGKQKIYKKISMVSNVGGGECRILHGGGECRGG